MSTPSRLAVSSPLKVFAVAWVGQLLSLIGSGLTSFALGIEVYKRTGSITRLSLVTFFATIPFVLVSPLAGVLVDRWNRRSALLLSDLGAGTCSFFIWGLITAGEAGIWPLRTWHFYLPFAISSLFAAIRGPALAAATTQLVPKQHLGRANGLLELANGASQLVAPVLAGALVVHIGLRGIVLIDLVTFFFAVGSLLLIRIPSLPAEVREAAAQRSLRQELTFGWDFIRARPGLMGLLLSVTLPNLISGLVTVLITPLILSFTTVSMLGVMLSLAGMGMLLGGISMSVWGGPKRLVRGVVSLQVIAGSVLLGGGLPASVPTVSLCAGMYLFTLPLTLGTVQLLWQRKVPVSMQGRVFAVRRMIGMAMAPLATLISGPLADRLFEPWLAPGGALAGSVGHLVGTGPGRGIGFLFVVMGGLMGCNALVTWLSPRVRHLEEELPDTLPDSKPGTLTHLPAPSSGQPSAETASPASVASGGTPS